MPLENGQEEREAGAVEADRRPPRRAVLHRHRQRLDLEEERPRPLDGREDRRAGPPARAAPEVERRGVRHLDEPVARHLEYAELVNGAEPVLQGAQDPVRLEPLPFEREDRVDEVLEGLRPGERAVLRDVADEDDRSPARLREDGEPRRRVPYLRDGARRRRQVGRGDGLDRVDHEAGPRPRRRRLEDPVDGGLREEVEAVHDRAETVRAQADLPRRLLGRDVEDLAGPRGKPCGDLQQERRLSDPRLAAEEDDGARDEAAAEHPVDVREPRQKPRRVGGVHIPHPDDAGTRDDRGSLPRTDRPLRLSFDERVPAAALRAAAEPARALGVARRAREDAPRALRHQGSIPIAAGRSVLMSSSFQRIPAPRKNERPAGLMTSVTPARKNIAPRLCHWP